MPFNTVWKSQIMAEININELTEYCKAFSGLTPEREVLLKEIKEEITPHLAGVTNAFYAELEKIEKAKPFLEGKLEGLKKTHGEWLEGIFSDDFDDNYTKHIYHVGDVHVTIKLPVEFMAGAMAQIQRNLTPILIKLYGDDLPKLEAVTEAIIAALGFNLQVMQESYQSSSLSAELEKFLKITGMSRTLFDNLALAYDI